MLLLLFITLSYQHYSNGSLLKSVSWTSDLTVLSWSHTVSWLVWYHYQVWDVNPFLLDWFLQHVYTMYQSLLDRYPQQMYDIYRYQSTHFVVVWEVGNQFNPDSRWRSNQLCVHVNRFKMTVHGCKLLKENLGNKMDMAVCGTNKLIHSRKGNCSQSACLWLVTFRQGCLIIIKVICYHCWLKFWQVTNPQTFVYRSTLIFLLWKCCFFIRFPVLGSLIGFSVYCKLIIWCQVHTGFIYPNVRISKFLKALIFLSNCVAKILQVHFNTDWSLLWLLDWIKIQIVFVRTSKC